MTPYEYLKQYRSLSVKLLDGRCLFGIDVHEYRNASDYFQHTSKISADHDVDAGMDIAYRALSKKIRQKGKKIAAGRYRLDFDVDTGTACMGAVEYVAMAEIMRCYDGKATPKLAQQALRLAVAFDLVDPNLAALNDYCTKFIGVDCSGFVGSYLEEQGRGGFTFSTPAGSFAPPNRRLERLDQIQDLTVLCWTNGGHVAIVDKVLDKVCGPGGGGPTSVVAMVAESCGSSLIAGDVHTDGLNYTCYTFLSVQHKVFQVKRGLGGTRANEVYLANL